MLVVADAASEGQVFLFDLDDRRVASRFTFRGVRGDYADAGGIALAEDSSLYVPDTHACCVRRFSLFGNEVETLGPKITVARDRRGLLAYPRAVCLDSQERLWIACGDRPWVHGLQVFTRAGKLVTSVHAFGRRESTFGPALGVAASGAQIWVADTGNDCVQCFREDGGFVAAWELPGEHEKPMAVAPWSEGRFVLVSEPRPVVLRFDRNFRPLGPIAVPAGHELVGPSDLQVHGERLFVLDRDGERVLSFTLDGQLDEVVFDSEEW